MRSTLVALLVVVALVGSLTLALAGITFTPPTWVSGAAPAAADLRAVAFVDATTGYAAGAAGVLRTNDSGASWSPLTTESTATLNALAVTADRAVWAVGASGTVLASIDGTSWSAQSSGVVTELLGVDFIDASRGWAVGRGGKVIATTDGGSMWTTQAAGVSTATALYGVAFADSRSGWAWGDGGTIARTTDAGSTWTTGTAAGAEITLYAGAFRDASTGWVAGSGGVVRKTVDGGATWTTQTIETTASIFGISFVDADRGFLVGGESTSTPGVIACTVDGGVTWKRQPSAIRGVHRAVQFIDAGHGWIVGDGGRVLRTIPERVPAAPATPSAPAVPVAVYARALQSGDVILGWSESANATASVVYRVWRSVRGAGYTSVAMVPAAEGPGFTDTAAPALKTVEYRVSVIGPSGETSPSRSVMVVTKARPAALGDLPAEMSCTGCHTVHLAPGNIGDPGAAGRCTNCHPGIGECLSGDDAGTRHDLVPGDQETHASGIACASCHNPHSSSVSTPIVDPDDRSPSGGMAGVTDGFCLACHDGSLPVTAQAARQAGGPSEAALAAVAGEVDVSDAWRVDVHGGTAGAGDSQLRPGMGFSKGDALACTNCHDPHGSTNRWGLLESVYSVDGTRHASALLVRAVPDGGADLRLFCSGCHLLASHPTASDGGADLTRWPIDCTGCHSHGAGL